MASDNVSSLGSSKLVAGPPLDYSFKELETVQDILDTTPVSGYPKRSAQSNAHAESTDGLENDDGNWSYACTSLCYSINSTAVKLSNNHLARLDGLEEVLMEIMDDVSELVWLDLSCNDLTHVPDALLKFPKLQVLYLHGNGISKLAELHKLARLPMLQKLTLHGNPVNELPNYRLHVSGHLRGLRSLDFSAITKVDRDRIDVWMRGHERRKSGKD